MKILSKIILPVAVISMAMISSCKDDDPCEAGTGGSLTLIARLKHHGVTISNDSLRPDTVWVKFNAKDWGNAPAGADLTIIGEAGEDHVHIPNLKCGDYYLYAAGWDISGPYEVRGGRPFSTDKTDGEYPIEIAVTE